jgi:hypothetical protein
VGTVTVTATRSECIAARSRLTVETPPMSLLLTPMAASTLRLARVKSLNIVLTVAITAGRQSCVLKVAEASMLALANCGKLAVMTCTTIDRLHLVIMEVGTQKVLVTGDTV